MLFNKTENEIREEIFHEVRKLLPQITYFNEGGVLRGFLEIVARFIKVIYDLLNIVFENAFVQTASGIWLDMKCAEIGLYRFEARKTKGMVVFERDNTTTNIHIPAGTIVQSKTMPDGKKYRFFTNNPAVLRADQAFVMVEVEAELPGTAYNLPPYTITEITTPLPGIDRIYNRPDWITQPGLDAETDESLRQRYKLAWQSISGTTLSAYESWARSVPGVAQVAVIPVGRGGGTVDVVITSVSGEASDELLLSVKQAIDDRKPFGVDVYVYRPEPVAIDVSLSLVLFSFADEENVLQSMQEKVYNLFSAMPIGKDFVLSEFVASVRQEGVKDIQILSPQTNITVNVKQIAKLRNLSIAVENITGEW